MSEAPAATRRPPRFSGAVRVASGILSSRLAGFLRDAALAGFFGVGPHADIFRTALRSPNVLQNLLGEQTLSASFIPIYSRWLGEGREEEAGRFAGAIFGLLLAAAGGLALAGVLLARPIVYLLAPGYSTDAAAVAAGTLAVDRFALSVLAVRIMFPMTGILVLSAWCLGVLNSHRRFFLPYFAPVLWNAAIVAAIWMAAAGGAGSLAAAAPARLERLLFAACWGAVVGGVLQFVVQVPAVMRVIRGFRLSLSLAVPGVRAALRAFTPLVASRGVIQLSGYLDLILGSLLAAGAVGSLGWAQSLYLLPVSLFGMAVAAAELPELARRDVARGSEELVVRLDRALRQMAFLTVPTLVGYLAFGFLVVGALYRRGLFGLADNWLVYAVLCGYSLGLVANNGSRLLANVFYARGETRIPAAVAVRRVAVSLVLGLGLMFWLDRYRLSAWLGEGAGDLRLGAVGLAAAAGIAAWAELALLYRRLSGVIPALRLPVRPVLSMTALALAAAIPAGVLWWLLPELPPLLAGPPVLGLYAAGYLLICHLRRIPEAESWLGRLRPRR